MSTAKVRASELVRHAVNRKVSMAGSFVVVAPVGDYCPGAICAACAEGVFRAVRVAPYRLGGDNVDHEECRRARGVSEPPRLKDRVSGSDGVDEGTSQPDLPELRRWEAHA